MSHFGLGKIPHVERIGAHLSSMIMKGRGGGGGGDMAYSAATKPVPTSLRVELGRMKN